MAVVCQMSISTTTIVAWEEETIDIIPDLFAEAISETINTEQDHMIDEDETCVSITTVVVQEVEVGD